MTTPTISTLLLIPAEGDPHGLLAPGVCGGCPPLLCRGPGRPKWSRSPALGCYSGEGWHFALVLAFAGKPVTAGCDLLDKPAAFWPNRGVWQQVSWIVGEADATTRRIAFNNAGHLLRSLGTLIALDPAGRDVTDEVMRGR